MKFTECVMCTGKCILVKKNLYTEGYQYKSELKQYLKWKHTDFLVKKKFQVQQSVKKGDPEIFM